MAKSPASQPSSAAPKSANGARPTTGGRPAGLFTFIGVGLVVVLVAVVVIVKVTSGGPSAGASSPTDASIVAELAGVPASVFNTVGVSGLSVTPPQVLKGQPELTAANAAGQTVPKVLYIGAEYCPYCAAQRWATIIALDRFGSFKGLWNIASSSGDVYPSTPTFTFLHATYTSKYLVFQSYEIQDVNHATLQTPDKASEALITKYDTPAYVKGMTAAQAGSIPFITLGNKFLVSGASYNPGILAGLTHAQIASNLTATSSPITGDIITSANYQTAAICTLTKEQPASVCTSKGVEAAKTAMKI